MDIVYASAFAVLTKHVGQAVFTSEYAVTLGRILRIIRHAHGYSIHNHVINFVVIASCVFDAQHIA